jgi:hypothetical protein
MIQLIEKRAQSITYFILNQIKLKGCLTYHIHANRRPNNVDDRRMLDIETCLHARGEWGFMIGRNAQWRHNNLEIIRFGKYRQ